MAITESRLLSLPRELRDLIYHHSMTQTFSPPTRALRVIPPANTDGQLYNWTDPPRWQPLNLLLVSHQIRTETLSLISQLENSNRLHATLDIFNSGTVFTTKWTHVNLGMRPRSKVDLHVNLTILSTEAFRQNGSAHWLGTAPPTLLTLLNRFIFDGPSFLDHNPPRKIPGPFFINTLSVHVAFRDDYTPDTWPGAVHCIFKALKALTRLQTAGRYLGKVRAETEYEYRGEVVRREREWVVEPAEVEPEGRYAEADWAAFGYPFGEEWLKFNRQGVETGAS